MTATTQSSSQTVNVLNDASSCHTQLFFDRDVELVLCEESRQCQYKRFYNKKALCTCPKMEAGD